MDVPCNLDPHNPRRGFPRRNGFHVSQRRRSISVGQRVRAAEHVEDPQLHFWMAGGSGLAGFHRCVRLPNGECYFDPCFDGESWLCADCLVSLENSAETADVT